MPIEKRYLPVMNPCGHTGFESGVCEVCGYPDPRKAIAARDERIKQMEESNVCLNTLCETTRTTISILTKELDAAANRIKALEAELSKWEQPFNREKFDIIKEQASHRDSLAAQQVYITALEHALKSSIEIKFVRHIESHLTGNQIPICKICGKDILEIADVPIILK